MAECDFLYVRKVDIAEGIAYRVTWQLGLARLVLEIIRLVFLGIRGKKRYSIRDVYRVLIALDQAREQERKSVIVKFIIIWIMKFNKNFWIEF